MASRSGVRKLLTSGGPGGSVLRHLLPAAIGAAGRARLPALARRGPGPATRREAELKRSSRYFELSRDLVCTAGFDGYFKQLNPSWTEALGWSEEELRSRPFVEFVHDDDRARTEEESAGLRSGRRHRRLRQPLRDQGRRLALDRMELDGDPRGGAHLRLGARRHPAQGHRGGPRAQRPSHPPDRRERRTTPSSRSTRAAGSPDWNSQAEASFGWARGEALGRELAETIIPERLRAAHRRGLERFLATARGRCSGRRLELTALHRDGREFPVELTISPIEMEQGYAFNAFLRDITERKGAEQELALARDAGARGVADEVDVRGQREPRDPHADERRDRHDASCCSTPSSTTSSASTPRRSPPPARRC